MFSVFSNTNLKPSDKIKTLQQCAGSIYTRILFAGSEDEPLYILKPKVINILEWVNRRILFELPRVKNNYEAQWIGVRLRIATNLFNKMVDEGLLTKDIAIEYHQRMTSRVKEILGEIYTEDLPFQG